VAEYLLHFCVATLGIIMVLLCIFMLRLRGQLRSLRARVRRLQHSVDSFEERNLLLALKHREEALGSTPNLQPPKSESAEVVPLKSLSTAPPVIGTR
jgi:hypothetical protein